MNGVLQRGDIAPLNANGHNFPGVKLDLSGSLVNYAGIFRPNLACLALNNGGELLHETDWAAVQSPDRAVLITKSCAEVDMSDVAIITPNSVNPGIAALYFGFTLPEGHTLQGANSVKCTLSVTGYGDGGRELGSFTINGLDGHRGAVLVGLLRGMGLWHAQMVGVPTAAAMNAAQLQVISRECLLSVQ